MKREALADKILVLGVDGFDPSLAKKFMDQGKMPALQQFVSRGSARENLVLLGGMPTVTPPMWTTLATGACPATHGITGFFNQHKTKLDTVVYALDSRECHAEQLWNVLAEEGKKTLVWHWPGSSWPPSSDSPNLNVVDGTQPAAVGMGVGVRDWEILGMASEKVEASGFVMSDTGGEGEGMAGCVITGLEDTVAKADAPSKMTGLEVQAAFSSKETTFLVTDESLTEINLLGEMSPGKEQSSIKPAAGWAAAPEDAKEFAIFTSGGLVRRPALILKNADGIYDEIAIYKSKKDKEPIFRVKAGELKPDYVDEVIHKDKHVRANRNFCLLDVAEDGSSLSYALGIALDMDSTAIWSPASLHDEIVEHVGYPNAISRLSGRNPLTAEKILIPGWDNYCEWQANSLTYLMDEGRYDVVFSHLHNVDNLAHHLWHFAKHRDEWGNDEKRYQKMMERIYIQTDTYLKHFLKYLDEGWTIFILSDHGLIAEENHPPILTEATVSVPVMKELGYTVLQKDENGEDMQAIDWTQTKAVATRGGHIYLNLKDRYDYGIVTEEERYDLEAQIISDLYNYRDPHTGKRTVAVALRNKDAIVLGMGGPECGDIVFFMEEGYNIIHQDSLTTQKGYFDTSVSPLFVAAGKGIKENYTMERIIREMDVAPTMAAMLGVRMPAQNEGSIAHQMFTEEF